MNKKEKQILSYIENEVKVYPSFHQVEASLGLSANKKIKRGRSTFFKPRLIFRAAYFCLLSASVISIAYSFSNPKEPETPNPSNFLSNFNNKNEINQFLKNNTAWINDSSQISSELDSQDTLETGIDYSKTNTQEKDVDEGDIVKTDGQHIYFLSYDGLKILTVNNGDLSLTYSEEYTNFRPIEMYLHQNRAIIIGEEFSSEPIYPNQITLGSLDCAYFYGFSQTVISIYDFSNITTPQLLQKLTIDGWYHTSRIAGDSLYYFVSAHLAYSDETIKLPTIANSADEDGVVKEIEPESIYYIPDTYIYSYTSLSIVGKLDLSTPQKNDYLAYLGASSDVYVSSQNIYQYFYYYNLETQISGNIIIKISLSNLEPLAICQVIGYINNRYSLDEYNGFLRVATTVSYWDAKNHNTIRYNNVYVFDENLLLTGSITGIAFGESIYSARFEGTTGYIVTFEVVDPFYTIDLSDPYNPVITSELKLDGVSYYIHKIEGTPYTISVGRDTEVVNGSVVWKGLKVTMYETIDLETQEINSLYIGDYYSYAEILYNPKALVYHQERNVFAFTAEEWSYDASSYCEVSQGLFVFGFENGVLEQRAFLTNFDGVISYQNYDYYDYYNNYFSYVRRGLTIGDYIYTISDRFVSSYSLNDFSLVNKLVISDISY